MLLSSAAVSMKTATLWHLDLGGGNWNVFFKPNSHVSEWICGCECINGCVQPLLSYGPWKVRHKGIWPLGSPLLLLRDTGKCNMVPANGWKTWASVVIETGIPRQILYMTSNAALILWYIVWAFICGCLLWLFKLHGKLRYLWLLLFAFNETVNCISNRQLQNLTEITLANAVVVATTVAPCVTGKP